MKKDNFMKTVERFMSGTQEIVSIQQDRKDGYMQMTAYYILPGIFLTLNDVHTQSVPSNSENMPKEALLINYCMQGRCEFRLDEDNYSYIDTNLMNIASRLVQEQFYYPSSYYMGYEIYLLPSFFTERTEETLKLFHIDWRELLQLYQKGVAFYAPAGILKLWNHIAEYCTRGDIGQLRLDTLQLLKYFQNNRPSESADMLYLSKVQAMLAKQAQLMLTQDLSRHLSVKSVAESLGVSETSLKRYFRSVFGANISAYMNEARMKYAAELLTGSKDSISDIAKACGYVNQGRFASVFRECYGMKPLDYRRNAALSTDISIKESGVKSSICYEHL